MGDLFDKVLCKPLLAIVPAWIHPNDLSITRALIAIPVILYRDRPAISVTLFFVAVFLDLFDGPLARARGQKSELGAWLDTLADKIFVISILLFAAANVPFRLRMLLISVEILLIAVRVAKQYLQLPPDAYIWGKIKMWVESIAVGCVLTLSAFLLPISVWLFVLACFFGGISLFVHAKDIVLYLNDIRNHKDS